MKITINNCTISIMGFEFMCELYFNSATPTYREGTEQHREKCHTTLQTNRCPVLQQLLG